jgi:dTDP-4-amino-4,6-dideoxygalactose transaminase
LRLYTTIGQYAHVAAALIGCFPRKDHAVEQLERELERRLGIRNAIAVPMARVGLYATLKSLIRPGQKVIMSPYTIADVVNMVVCAAGKPVFADIERETCNISVVEAERLIDRDTGAVLVTHFYGLMADVDRLRSVCDERGIPMIEDAAQAFGASWNGRPAGAFGRAGVYSFGMYKNVNSFLGGAVVTEDDALAANIRGMIAQWPLQARGSFVGKVGSALLTDLVTLPPVFRSLSFWLFRYAFLHDVGLINDRLKIDLDPKIVRELSRRYRARMTPLQARLVLSQLDRVDQDMRQRIAAARIYYDGLKDVKELILPPMRADGSHIYWYFPIQAPDRRSLVAYAMRRFRDIAESHHRNCADMPSSSRSCSMPECG